MPKPAKSSAGQNAFEGTEIGQTASPRQLFAAGAILLVVVTCICYWPSLRGGFLLDDDLLLTNNDLIKANNGWYRSWYTTQQPDYVPLTSTMFWFEWRMWGMDPLGYHVVNVLLHLAASFLLWAILRKLNIPGAFLAALLFAVHPVNVESVAWIEQRKNTLALVLFLLSILWYLRGEVQREESEEETRRKGEATKPVGMGFGGWHWLSLLAFALAMFSKGSVAVLPVVLLLIVWWRNGRITRGDLIRSGPFFLLAAVLSPVILWFVTHGSEKSVRTAGFVERLSGAGAVVWFYLSKALLPIELIFVYPQWNIGGNLLWWLPLAGVLVVTGLLWARRDSRWRSWVRPLLFGWGFYCLALSPVAGFTDSGYAKYSLVADHYQYIAIIGVVALVGAAWCAWHDRRQGTAQTAASAVAVGIVVVLMALSFNQNRLYGDPIALYETTLKKNPACWMAHNNLGNELLRIGQPQQAIEHYEQSLWLNKDNPEAFNNLGSVLASMGRLQEAVECFSQSIKLKPDFTEAKSNLGKAYSDLKQWDQAIDQFQDILQATPDNAGARTTLALVFIKAGRPKEAAEQFEQSLRIDPGSVQTHIDLANIFSDLGQFPQAADQYQQVVRLRPDNAEARYHFADALAKANHPQEATDQLLAAVRLKPDYAAAHYDLANGLLQSHNIKEAIDHFRQAVNLNPELVQAQNNLANLLAKSGDVPGAIEQYQDLLRKRPDFEEAHNNLGVVLLSQGKNQEALEHFRQALKLRPENVDTQCNLGNVLLSTNQPQEAANHFQEVLRIQSSNLKAYAGLTRAYVQMQRPAEAIATAKKAMEIARTAGQTAEVQRIEAWLEKYRAQQANLNGK